MRFYGIAGVLLAGITVFGCGGSSDSGGGTSTTPGVPVTSEVKTPAAWDAIKANESATLRHAIGTEPRDFPGAVKVLSKYDDPDGAKLVLFENASDVKVGGGMSGALIHQGGKAVALVRQGDPYDPTHFEGILFSQAWDEATQAVAQGIRSRSAGRSRTLVPIRISDAIDLNRVKVWTARAKEKGIEVPDTFIVDKSGPAPTGATRATTGLSQGGMYAGSWCKYLYYAGHISASLGDDHWLTLGHGLDELPREYDLPVQPYFGYQAVDGYFNGHPTGNIQGTVDKSLNYGTIIRLGSAPLLNSAKTVVKEEEGPQLSTLSDWLAHDQGSYYEHISAWILLDQQVMKLLYNQRNRPEAFHVTLTAQFEGHDGVWSRSTRDIDEWTEEPIGPLNGPDRIDAARYYVDAWTTELMLEAWGQQLTAPPTVTIEFLPPDVSAMARRKRG